MAFQRVDEVDTSRMNIIVGSACDRADGWIDGRDHAVHGRGVIAWEDAVLRNAVLRTMP